MTEGRPGPDSPVTLRIQVVDADKLQNPLPGPRSLPTPNAAGYVNNIEELLPVLVPSGSPIFQMIICLGS